MTCEGTRVATTVDEEVYGLMLVVQSLGALGHEVVVLKMMVNWLDV